MSAHGRVPVRLAEPRQNSYWRRPSDEPRSLNSGLPRLRQGKDLVRIAYVASVQPGSPEQLVQGELLDLAASGAQVTLFMLSPARRLAQPHAQGVQAVVVELSEQLAAGVSAVAELEARELNALRGCSRPRHWPVDLRLKASLICMRTAPGRPSWPRSYTPSHVSRSARAFPRTELAARSLPPHSSDSSSRASLPTHA